MNKLLNILRIVLAIMVFVLGGYILISSNYKVLPGAVAEEASCLNQTMIVNRERKRS